MKRAAQAVERKDARALYRLIDQRARHAMHSIVEDRRAAAAVVRKKYPPEQRKEALKRLGDAAGVDGPRGLFAARCGDTCLQRFARKLAAPAKRTQDGEEWIVTTVKGTRLRMYHGDDDWWGIVWHTEELDAERDRANRDLMLIRRNAGVYAKRQRLGQDE